MSDYLTAMDELEAVNAVLATVGEAPVVSLDNLFVDAELALKLIRQVSRRLQTQGWTWNTDLGVTFPVNGSSEIPIPANVLRLVYTADTNLVPRGGKLYDRSKQSTIFTAPLVAEKVVLYLPFEELPEAARAFVQTRAGRQFQDQFQGSDLLHKIQQGDEIAAWAALQNYEAEVANYNVLNDSALVQRIKSLR